MIKLNAASRLQASVEDHVDDDELEAQDFIDSQPTTASDTLESQEPYDLSPYMFARKLAAKFRATAQGDLMQNQMQHPRTTDLETLTEGAIGVDSAMGDNAAETDPLMQDYENSNPRVANSTSDTPFDDFDNAETPNDMYLEDQPDIVRAAKHKHKKKKPKKSKSSDMIHRLLDEDAIMYQNEASTGDFNVSTGGQKSTYDSDDQPGSVDVRFPISPPPVDGSTYMNASLNAGRRLSAGFNSEEENPEVLGEPSEDGEVHIMSNAEPTEEEQEVLGDADPKVLWNVANQPLS
jgi:hypothetical protein